MQIMPSSQSHQAESIKSFWSDETKINTNIQGNNDQHETNNISSQVSFSSLSNRYQVIKKICRRSSESYKTFIKRASSEYCITSVLSHTNVINAKDMIMKEYHFELILNLEEPGVSLFDLIHSNFLSHQQMINYMYQLFQSIQYIHSIGIAHRDINLNNILVIQNDNHLHTLKLSNFSSADVFQHPCQKKLKQSSGRVGLIEYQSPETLFYHHHHHINKKPSSLLSSNQHYQQENDLHQYWATSLDIWSCGIVLFFLWKKKYPWALSCPLHDNQFRLFYQSYSLNDDNNTISSLQSLSIIPRQLIYKMLNPDSTTRISIDQLLYEYSLLIS
ncbi:unnamed protein product [Cunninghamella blakesleeana]